MVLALPVVAVDLATWVTVSRGSVASVTSMANKEATVEGTAIGAVAIVTAVAREYLHH